MALEDARRIVTDYVAHYNHVRLHSAVGYVTPHDRLLGNDAAIHAARDQKLAEAQRFCAVQEGVRLGSMGVPVKVTLEGQPVFLCCKGCLSTAQKDSEATVMRAQRLKAKKAE